MDYAHKDEFKAALNNDPDCKVKCFFMKETKTWGVPMPTLCWLTHFVRNLLEGDLKEAFLRLHSLRVPTKAREGIVQPHVTVIRVIDDSNVIEGSEPEVAMVLLSADPSGALAPFAL